MHLSGSSNAVMMGLLFKHILFAVILQQKG
jgi:hypothetical protein